MGYLDNTSITIDAVLTKKGREILKDGGNLNISSFTLSDTGVDYSLWNPSHPDGSAYYGEAIENLPMLEANVHAEHNLRNRLISLKQSTVAIPSLILGNMDQTNGSQKTFNEGDEADGTINVKMVGFNSQKNLGYRLIIQDTSVVGTNAKSIGGLSGTSRQFLPSTGIPHAQEFQFTGDSFSINPKQQDTAGQSTNITVLDIELGAYVEFTVTVNITKNTRAVRSSGGMGSTT